MSACAGDKVVGALHDAGVDAPMRMGPYDECGNGMDDDGDGLIDEGCLCGGGETQSCFTGTYPNRGVGACADGVQACDATSTMEFGHWGACTMDTLPADEACDGVDNDCDGAIDEGCPCTAGQTQGCGSEFAIAPCSSGTQTCGTDGTWSACEGAIGPSAEVCGPGGRGDGIDNDCDGMTDEGCTCVPEPEVCGDGLDNDCDGTVDEDACATPEPDAGVPDAGSLDAGADATVDVDGGMTSCIGAGDWELRFPIDALDGSSGSLAAGKHVVLDAEGVLVSGTFSNGRLALGSFTGISGPELPSGIIPFNTFIAGITPTGTLRYAYAPLTHPYDPPSTGDQVPEVNATDIVSDGSGGAWLSGYFQGTAEFAPSVIFNTPATGGVQFNLNALIFHVNSSGALVDARVFGRNNQSDRFGHIARRGDQLVIAGTTPGFFNMDGTSILPPSAMSPFLITLRPTSGSYSPEKVEYFEIASFESILTATNGIDLRYVIDARGTLDLGGEIIGLPDHRTVVVLRPSVSGYDTMSFTSSAGYASPVTANIGLDGDIVISGILNGTISFGGSPISAGNIGGFGGTGEFVTSLRPDGTENWSRAFNTTPVDPFHSLFDGSSAVDSDGNIYVAMTYGGTSGATVDLGAGPVALPRNALIFSSYSPDGALQWSRIETTTESDRMADDMAVDDCGGIYITGHYRQTSRSSGLYVRRISTL